MLDVPAVVPELSSRQVLTTEFIEGIPLDRCAELDQDTRDQVTNQFLLKSHLHQTFPSHFYAPLEKGGILFCNCRSVGMSVGRSVGRSVCRPCVVRSISFDPFNWSIPNLVKGLPSMSIWSLLIFKVTCSKVKFKLLFLAQCVVHYFNPLLTCFGQILHLQRR